VTYYLVVVHDFGPYKKGNMITAADEVAMILASPQHPHVNKIPAPPEETPPASTETPAARTKK
jgi:hypothetical protein